MKIENKRKLKEKNDLLKKIYIFQLRSIHLLIILQIIFPLFFTNTSSENLFHSPKNLLNIKDNHILTIKKDEKLNIEIDKI